MAHEYEVKLEDGRIVTWSGEDGPDACARAADCLGVAAIAWREEPATVAVVHHSQIIG
jgi:hypothetical protein